MDLIQKAYKFRLYPSKDQMTLITKTIGSCRFVFNHFLNEWETTYKSTSKGLSYSKCSAQLPNLKIQYEWLSEVDSTALQTAVRHLDTSYKNFFTGQADHPKFKSKNNPVQSYTSKFTNNNIRIEGKKIRLPKLGTVKFRQSREMKGRIISATVSKTSTNKYFVSLLVEEEQSKIYDKTNSAIGIDLGIKDLLVLSNGERTENIMQYKSLEEQLIRTQRTLSRKQIGSSNYIKTKVKLAKIHERIANIRMDYLHKVSAKIVKNHDVIAMEDLDVKSMLKNRQLSKSISDVSFSNLVEMIAYKSNWNNRIFVKVSKTFPSSQLCSICGYKNAQVKDLSIREWECPTCHNIHDRDFNASINILNEGLSIVLRTVGTTGIA